MCKWNMKPKPVRKAITIFFSVGRTNIDRSYNRNRFSKTPNIFYTKWLYFVKKKYKKILLSFIQQEADIFDLMRINQPT